MYSAQDIYTSVSLLYKANATFAESLATYIRNTSSVNAHFEVACVCQVYRKPTAALARILEVSEIAGKSVQLFQMTALHFSKKKKKIKKIIH